PTFCFLRKNDVHIEEIPYVELTLERAALGEKTFCVYENSPKEKNFLDIGLFLLSNGKIASGYF
ncbi:hypothetical protein, partial [Leptospira santarosai]|uniref:hypothetical protein n=1 Tax=Leptospira santarosai TaxID=28183 RepID=UPI0002BDD872